MLWCMLSIVLLSLLLSGRSLGDDATGSAPTVDSLQSTKSTKLPLQLVNALLQDDGTLNVGALKDHIDAISAKMSQRIATQDDPMAPVKTLNRRAGNPPPAPSRPRQQCQNRGIGRRDFAEGEMDQEDHVRSDDGIEFPGRAAWRDSGILTKRSGKRRAPQKPPPKAPPPHANATKDTPPSPTDGGGAVDGCRGGNFFWSTTIHVGNADIQAIIDTGSSLTIIDGNVYDAKGATYMKKNFTIDFVDGSAAGGHVFEENVKVANVLFSNSTVCRDEKGFNLDNASSYGLHGLIGLQRPGYAMKEAGIGGLLDGVRHILKHNLFSLSLTPSEGDLFLGGFDPLVPKENWTFVGVEDDPEGHWVVKASVNDMAMPKNVVIDSGTSSMLFDHDVAQKILDGMKLTVVTVEEMLLGVFNCYTPPRITIKIGDFTRLLTPETSVLGNVNSTHCYASVVGVPKDTQLSQSAILGGPFFTSESSEGCIHLSLGRVTIVACRSHSVANTLATTDQIQWLDLIS